VTEPYNLGDEEMKAINIKFQEEYKSVDKFIKDAFGSVDGVSEYIRTMERNEGNKSDEVWKDDYYKLKHMRWIRNQLAHEVSIDSDICEREDLEWLCDFHARLKKGDDSLAKTYRGKKNQASRRPKAQEKAFHTNKAKSAKGTIVGIGLIIGILLYVIVKYLA